MILVDDRSGSVSLAGSIGRRGVEVSVCSLNAGDFAFEGNGPHGKIMIGVERKTITDVVNCMCTGRLSGVQIPAMVDSYQVSYLIVEGLYRPNPASGLLEVYKMSFGGKIPSWTPLYLGQRAFMYRDVSGFLSTLECMTGVKLRRTSTETETSFCVADLWHWWNDKKWDEHESHQMFFSPGVEIWKPSLLRRWAKELDGIGRDKSKFVEGHFKSPLEMANAAISDWMKIKGIGQEIASKAFRSIRGC